MKKGDKVRRTNNKAVYGNGDVVPGDIGVIISTYADNVFVVDFKNRTPKWTASKTCIELVNKEIKFNYLIL